MWPCSRALDMKVKNGFSCTNNVSNDKLRLEFVCVWSGSSLEDSVVRWCCISHAEQKKCEQWALSIKSDPLVCVKASSMSDCIEKIKVQ